MSVNDQNPQYYCPISDRFISLGEADIVVVDRKAKRELPKPGEPVAQSNLVLRRSYDKEIAEVEEICHYFWNESQFHCFDQDFEIGSCINILAFAEDDIAGLLSWKKVDDAQIIVALNVYPEYQGQGIAHLLLKEALEQGRKQACRVARVATSNDDLPALSLYQKMGFQLTELCPGAIAQHHGEELKGFGGILVRDEVRLERGL